MVRVVRNYVVSDYCKATAWSEKLHSTLWIICVTNAKKNIFFNQYQLNFILNKQSYL